MSQSAVTYEQVEPLAEKLTHNEKLRLIKHLVTVLEREELAQMPKAPGWPPGFFERTAGSLADDPMERPPQGDYQERDEIE